MAVLSEQCMTFTNAFSLPSFNRKKNNVQGSKDILSVGYVTSSAQERIGWLAPDPSPGLFPRRSLCLLCAGQESSGFGALA